MNPRIPHQNRRFQAPQLYLILYMFTLLHISTNQELFEKYIFNQSSHYENTMVPRARVIIWNWFGLSIHCPSLSAVFDSLHSSTNQELFEKCLCNKNHHYEKYGRFLVTQGKPSRSTTKLTLFTVSKDKWTQRRTLVNPWRMHCMYCGMPKGTSRA